MFKILMTWKQNVNLEKFFFKFYTFTMFTYYL